MNQWMNEWMNEWINEWMNESMNEWINAYLYTAHITYCLKAVYKSWIEWDRTSACKGACGCRYRFIFDLIRPPNPCMKCTMKLQIDHNTGNYVPPALFDKCVGSLTSPTVYSPYPRRLECLTICWYNYKGSTFSSVILRPWVLVRSGARTLDLPHSRLAF